MDSADATLPRDVPHGEALSPPLIEDWTSCIRAMEAYHAAPVRHTPAEVRTAATWAARCGRQPPVLPASGRATNVRPIP